ncbi:MAG: PAS domain S-box protein [Candidatus Coatesbacteria bacterium]|nr:PAS domain S-box protein [Candidatus Coatesbacteria bacterium]
MFQKNRIPLSLSDLGSEENLSIRWILIFRALILVGILGTSIFVLDQSGVKVLVKYYGMFMLLILLTSGVFLYWWSSGKSRALFLYSQGLYDTLFCTGIIYLTGGFNSNLILLYFPLIVTNSIMLYLRGALLAATWATMAFWGIMLSEYYHYVTPLFSAEGTGLIPIADVFYRGYLFSLFFYLTAFSAGYLSEKLKDYQEQRKLSSERMRNVLNSMHSGVITLELNGNIAFINQSGLKHLGFSEDKITGKNINEIELENINNFIIELRKILKNHAIRTDRLEISLENNEILGLNTTLQVAPSGEELMIIVFQNLTNVKKLEQQVNDKEKLAFMGTIAAGIAHEIRNPLAAISGSVQMLSKSKIDNADRQQLESLIMKETDRLNLIIEDFLDLTKIPQPEFVPLDINAEINEIVNLFKQDKSILKDKRIDIDIPENTIIRIDNNHFHQICINVLRNALESLNDNGYIRISSIDHHPQVKLFFQDNGKGIKKSNINQVFDPFFSKKKGGVGLGLTIVKQLVSMNNGQISIQSEEEKGTLVTIVFEKWTE